MQEKLGYLIKNLRMGFIWAFFPGVFCTVPSFYTGPDRISRVFLHGPHLSMRT